MREIESKSKQTKINKLQEKLYVLGRIIWVVFFVAGVVLGFTGLILPASILIGIGVLGGTVNIITRMLHSKEISSSQKGLEKGVENKDKKFREKEDKKSTEKKLEKEVESKDRKFREKEDKKSTEKKLENGIESKDKVFLLSRGDLELMRKDIEKVSREVSNNGVHSADIKYEIVREDGTTIEISTKIEKV